MPRVVTMLILAGVLGAVETAAQPLVVNGTTRQLTTDPAPQLLGRISGDRVVFTDQRNGNDDVYVIDVTTGAETQVTSASTPQRLNDISGDRVVFTDFNSPHRRIGIHDLATGVTTYPSPDTEGQNPQIDGTIVAWERNLGNLADVVVFDLTSNTEVVIDFGGPEISPAPDGTRVAFEARVNAAAPGDIYLYDTVSETSARLTMSTDDDRRADLDGNLVVWESSDGTTLDIMVHDLATGITRRLALPGNQRWPHVSGRVVTFDDDSLGDSNVGLYFLDADQVVFTTTELSNEFLNDIDGNRIAFTSNNAGNYDIWLYEFLVEPLQSIAPAAGLEFGSVTVGQQSQQIATISHPQNTTVTVQSVAIVGAAAANFAAALTVPATIGVAGSLDIPVTFAPTATGVRAARLDVTTNLGLLQVPLAGTGVSIGVPPQQQVAALLSFFDAAVASGTLTGSGNGNSAGGRRTALRNMLEAAGDLIAEGRIDDACQQLADAAARTDGASPPPDFVAGVAAPELLQRIGALRAALGCQ